MKEDFLEALRKGKGYDYIADNYWHISVEALKDCCLELIYKLDNIDKTAINDVADELEDRWNY